MSHHGTALHWNQKMGWQTGLEVSVLDQVCGSADRKENESLCNFSFRLSSHVHIWHQWRLLTVPWTMRANVSKTHFFIENLATEVRGMKNVEWWCSLFSCECTLLWDAVVHVTSWHSIALELEDGVTNMVGGECVGPSLWLCWQERKWVTLPFQFQTQQPRTHSTSMEVVDSSLNQACKCFKKLFFIENLATEVTGMKNVEVTKHFIATVCKTFA